MRRPVIITAALAALALSGCGSAKPAAPAPVPRAAAFPAALPTGTSLAYAVRQLPLFAGTSRGPALGAPIESLALTTARTVWVSCRTGSPMRPAGAVSAATAAAWGRALSGHLSRVASDPADPQHRGFWFAQGGRTVYLDFVRHVSRAPCQGTECAAALHIDTTLTGLQGAMTAFSGYLAQHCPPA